MLVGGLKCEKKEQERKTGLVCSPLRPNDCTVVQGWQTVHDRTREHNSQPVQTTAPPTSCSKSLVLHFQVSVDTSLTDREHHNSNGGESADAKQTRLRWGHVTSPSSVSNDGGLHTHTHLAASVYQHLTQTQTLAHTHLTPRAFLFLCHTWLASLYRLRKCVPSSWWHVDISRPLRC